MLARLSPLALAAALGLLAGPLAADTIVGRVVDENGVGIAGVDIDVKNLLGGGDPPLSNDGTDAGGFFNTTLPAGLYDITFIPPPPPASTSLIFELQDVGVVGTTNLGVLEAPAGVALEGRAVTATGIPVADVNLDVIDLASGDNLDLIADKTDVFGRFAIAVPTGQVELRFDSTPVLGPPLASKALELALSVDTDIGDVILPPGMRITAQVVGPAGPLANADTDTIDTLTGTELYTPKDNTAANGLVSVVVPAGTYDFEVCPPTGALIVGHEIFDLVVAADVNLGQIPLLPGVTLAGTITAGGAPIAGVDVDVVDPITGAPVALCSDNTNAAGLYAVVVPQGTWDVCFDPPFSVPFASLTQTVVVSGPTNLGGALPPCPFPTQYGTGLAGTGGVVPGLSSSGGAPRLGNESWVLEFENGVGGSLATVIIGLGQAAFPFKGGTLLVDPGLLNVLITVPLGGAPGVAGAGSFSLPLPVPNDAIFLGLTWYGQQLVVDAAGPKGFAMSPGLQVTYCD